MKLKSAFILLFPFFLTNPAYSVTSLKWSQLDSKDLRVLIEDAKEILQEGEAVELFSRVEMKNQFNLLSNEAFALTSAYDCFYAGWPSQLKTDHGKKYCTSPKDHPNYVRLPCKSDELACNPILFGPNQCLSHSVESEKTHLFSQCESQFRKKGDDYRFLKNLSAAHAKTLNETLSVVRNVCEKGDIGTQKATRMCASFLSKVDRLTEKQLYRDHAPQIKKDQDSAVIQPLLKKSGAPKETTCCEIQASPAVALKGISEVTQAIQKNNDTPTQQLYDSLKKQFEASPLCRIQSRMTDEEKTMNALAHYTRGLAQIVSGGKEGSQELFIAKTVSELDLDPDLTDSYKKSVQSADEVTRRAFKYDLTEKIIAKLKSDPNLLDKAIEGSLADRNMANCTFVNFDAFEKAMKGRQKLKNKFGPGKEGLMTIVDYTLPYSARRLFVIDVEKQQTLQNTWVALGGGGGNAITNPDGSNPKTSSVNGSMMSSEGFAISGEPYTGTWGPSMRIDGQDLNNSTMRSRAVVLHGWPELDYTPYNQYKAFYPDLPKRMNRLMSGQVSVDPKQMGELDSILNGIDTQMHTLRIPYTDGCLGIPPSDVASVRSAISGKSMIYLYTGEDQKSRFF